MKKASLKPQPVGYQVYRAISQLNRQFEEQVETLDHLISFNILPFTNLRAYQVMLEEVRSLINNELHEVLGEREFHNSAYYEHLRLKWQQELADGKAQVSKSRSRRQKKAVRP